MSSTNNNELEEFGNKLRKLRISRQMTLLELAEELGYTTHSYISEIESGHKMPTALFVLKVARFFEIDADTLLRDEKKLDEN